MCENMYMVYASRNSMSLLGRFYGGASLIMYVMK